MVGVVFDVVTHGCQSVNTAVDIKSTQAPNVMRKGRRSAVYEYLVLLTIDVSPASLLVIQRDHQRAGRDCVASRATRKEFMTSTYAALGAAAGVAVAGAAVAGAGAHLD